MTILTAVLEGEHAEYYRRQLAACHALAERLLADAPERRLRTMTENFGRVVSHVGAAVDVLAQTAKGELWSIVLTPPEAGMTEWHAAVVGDGGSIAGATGGTALGALIAAGERARWGVTT